MIPLHINWSTEHTGTRGFVPAIFQRYINHILIMGVDYAHQSG